MADLSEEDAEEVLEKARKLEGDHDIDTIEQAREVVEAESSGLTKNQTDALTTILGGGALVTGSVFGPAGIVASSAAVAYIVKDADTVVSAYKDGAGQVETVIKNLKSKF